MATIKHVSIKNANYGYAEMYLKYEHSEKNQKPKRDENGHLIERKNYIINSVNCHVETFGIECIQANLKYNKNQRRNDIKAHHYIISFDPKDKAKGLTVEKAQKLGEEFCKKNFRGHQAIVCTHADGHNRSGNIHCHIIFNSVRIETIKKLSYMDRPSEYKEGFKHRCSGKFMYFIREKLMNMCHREKLNQIDLLHGKTGIKDREYYAQKRGTVKEKDIVPLQTEFETYKQELRDCISVAQLKTNSFEEMKDYLKKEYNICTKESRGRIAYIHPLRKRPIRDDKLGRDFRKENLIYGNTKHFGDNPERRATSYPSAKHTRSDPSRRTAVDWRKFSNDVTTYSRNQLSERSGNQSNNEIGTRIQQKITDSRDRATGFSQGNNRTNSSSIKPQSRDVGQATKFHGTLQNEQSGTRKSHNRKRPKRNS